MTPYSMGVDTIVLMDHTTPTNEYHDNYANNNNSLNRGSVVRRDISTCHNVLLQI